MFGFIILTFFACVIIFITGAVLPERISKYFVPAEILTYIGMVIFFFILPFFVTIPGYSDGCRTVVVEKISQKGVVWKTWEGSGILAGYTTGDEGAMNREIWNFSVIDEKLAKEIQEYSGTKVTLCYDENYVTKYSDASTNYIIKTLKQVKN